MSTYQLSIVLLYNDADKIPISEIAQNTGLPMKEIHQNLNALVNAGVLLSSEDISKV